MNKIQQFTAIIEREEDGYQNLRKFLVKPPRVGRMAIRPYDMDM